MNIVHIITAFGIGGAEKMLLNSINKQAETHIVHLIYLKPINDLIPLVDKRVIIKNIQLSLITTIRLRKYLTHINPDIIHTHLGHADILGLWCARKLKAKTFTTIHSTKFKNNWKDKIYFKFYRIMFLKISKNTHIISVSESIKKIVKEKLKIPKYRIHVLYNAIPKIPNKKVIAHKEVNILFLGRLTKAKSVVTLLRAIKNLESKKIKNKFKLLIVGDGELRSKLERLTTNLQLENLVRFEGAQKDVNKYFSQSDIFVLPSIWEGFGIVILEAFSAKLAVIASNIEGPAELIENEVNGLLFEPKNHVQLSEKMAQLINNNELRARIASNGYLSFTKKYDIDNYVEKLNELYESV